MRVRGKREQGIALLVTILTMVVVAGISTLLFVRTLNEMKHSRDDAGIVQTLLLARGGANLGGAVLAGAVRDDLNEIVNVRSSTTDCWSFGSGSCSSERPNPGSVVADLSGPDSVATQLQETIDDLLCGETVGDFGDGAQVSVRVYVTSQACGNELPGGVSLPEGRFVGGAPRPANQDYALPFVMVSEATLGEYKRNVVLQGEYQFTVGRVTFAQFALFTNHHTSNSEGIWFTDDTLFDGPVHTNEYFRFYGEPWFGHKVTSAGCPSYRRSDRVNPSTGQAEEYCTQANPGAYFHDRQNTLRTNLGPNPSFGRRPRNAPEFTAGVDWRAEYVPLPSNNIEQETVARNSGIYIDSDIDRVVMWAGDEDGNELERDMLGRWQGPATHQYIKVWSQEKTVCVDPGWFSCYRWEFVEGRDQLYRYAEDGRLEERVDGDWQVALNEYGQPVTNFNGVVHVDGKIESLEGPERTGWNDSEPAPPAIASFAQITVSASNRITINEDLKYEEPPCSSPPIRNRNGTVTPAECDDLEARNVLGVYSQYSDIMVGSSAPNDLKIHGVLMSSEGIVGVEGYNSGSHRGTVELIGGIIQNRYGPFGTFNPTTGRHNTGYDRSFTYDPRMYATVSPPYFPTIGLDKVKDVRVFSFGSREQVY